MTWFAAGRISFDVYLLYLVELSLPVIISQSIIIHQERPRTLYVIRYGRASSQESRGDSFSC